MRTLLGRVSAAFVLGAVLIAVAGCGGGGTDAVSTALRDDGRIAIPAQTLTLADDAGKAVARTVTTPDVTVVPGGEFVLPVAISDKTGVAGAAVSLAYDKTVLACTAVTPGDALPSSAQTASHVSAAGNAAAFAAAGTEAASSGKGLLVTFRMRVLAAAKPKNATVKVSGLLADSKGRTIGRFAAGTAAPRGGAGPRSRPMQATGLIGDLMGTGNPEVGSAIKILRVVVGLDPQPAAADLWQWDCDKSGVLDVADAIKILRCVVGLDAWPIGTGPGGGEGTFNVTWDPSTTYIDQAHLGLLKSSDDVNFQYTFDAAGVQSAGLDLSAGRVLVIYGKALRKITSATPSGSDLIVATDYAALTDAIVDGDISWDHQVRFTPDIVATQQVSPQQISVNGNKLSLTYQMDPYTYKIQMTLNDSSADCTITVEKTLVGVIKGTFTVTGTIQGFHAKDSITIRNHATTAASHSLDGMTGELTVGLVVAGSGSDALNFKLPVPLLKIPFLVGPIPCTLNVGIQFVANAQVPLDGSAQVSAKFTYDSAVGFQYAGTDVTANATVGPYSIVKNVAQTGASSAIGVNFGVGFPRVSLGLFADSLSPWAQTAFLVGGNYTFYPACQQAKASFIGSAGYNLSILGIPLLSGSKTLWQNDQVLLSSGSCPAAATASAPAMQLRGMPPLF